MRSAATQTHRSVWLAMTQMLESCSFGDKLCTSLHNYSVSIVWRVIYEYGIEPLTCKTGGEGGREDERRTQIAVICWGALFSG